MLKFVILIVVFVLFFWFIYDQTKRLIIYWQSELTEKDTLEDRMNKLNIERSQFNNDLNKKSTQLKKEFKNIEKMKKKGFKNE